MQRAWLSCLRLGKGTEQQHGDLQPVVIREDPQDLLSQVLAVRIQVRSGARRGRGRDVVVRLVVAFPVQRDHLRARMHDPADAVLRGGTSDVVRTQSVDAERLYWIVPDNRAVDDGVHVLTRGEDFL